MELMQRAANIARDGASRRTDALASESEAPANIPRYAEVAQDLIARIAAGEYPVGSLLPTEIELSETYGISRHTLREALRRLDEAGLLSRRRRAGTEILRAQPAPSYRQPISSINDLLQYGEDTEIRRKRQRVVRCDADLAGFIGCEPGRKWLRVDSIRVQRGDTRPICHTTLYLSLALKGIEGHVASRAAPVSATIEEIYGIRVAEIEQSIEAISLGADDARRLKSKPGAAALKATRRYYDDRKQLIEVAIALHPGDRFVYTTRLFRE